MPDRLFTPTYTVEGVEYNAKNGVSLNSRMEPPSVTTVGVGKGLDPNQYATKKTVAQGMLDVALLTANASQLKYVLSVGEAHEFYHIMLGLITTSLVLQGLAAILMGPLTVLNITKKEHHKSTEMINHVILTLSMLVMAIDAIKLGFDNGMVVRKNSTTLIP
ncbi:hypothetical protein O3P69_017015 [Scylla paramamosain]|uniref:Uncharacterized protein n=1 Tax=Scylla paramamosain TaxID=85552 RepID=A0AAW0TWM6_SCYPA